MKVAFTPFPPSHTHTHTPPTNSTTLSVPLKQTNNSDLHLTSLINRQWSQIILTQIISYDKKILNFVYISFSFDRGQNKFEENIYTNRLYSLGIKYIFLRIHNAIKNV